MKKCLIFLFCLTGVFKIGTAQSDPPALLFPMQPYTYEMPAMIDYDWNGQVDVLMPDGLVYLNPDSPQSGWISTDIIGAPYQFAHDFNGDGKPDVLFINSEMDPDHKLGLAINSSGATSVQQLLEVNTVSFFSDDVDQDGDHDIGAGSHILLNDGNANFTTVDLANNRFVQFAADIDGDGLRDIISSNGENSFTTMDSLFWNHNSGSGYDPVNLIQVTGLPAEFVAFQQIGFFDLDNDLDDDLGFVGAFPDGAHGLVAENLGGGVFQVITDEVLNMGFYDYPSMARVDIDADGDQDLTSGIAVLFINQGGGIADLELYPEPYIESIEAFHKSVCYELPGAYFGGQVVDDFLHGTVSDYQYMGSYPLELQTVFNWRMLGDMVSVFVEDNDQDGDLDLLLAGANFNGAFSWCQLLRSPSDEMLYGDVICVPQLNNAANPTGYFGAADWDNNGVTNLASSSEYLAEMFEFPAVGMYPSTDGDFPFVHSYSDNAPSGNIDSKDLNGDGWMDCLFHFMGEGETVFMNDNGNFVPMDDYTTVTYLPQNPSPNKVGGYVSLDVNNDGLLDFWSPMHSNAFIQGPGFTFDEIICPVFPYAYPDPYPFTYEVQNFRDKPEVFDFDGDGFDDVLLQGYLFHNDGGTQFTPTELVDAPFNFYSSMWDFDQDNDPDIFLSFYPFMEENGNIYLSENMGSGVFADPVIALANSRFYTEAIVDWEDDGDDEFVFSGVVNGQRGVYAWGAVTATVDPAQISGVVFYDLNANGVQDVGEMPMANKQVKLDYNFTHISHFTDANGFFAFHLLDDEDYTVSVTNLVSGYVCEVSTVDLSISGGIDQVVNFAFEPLDNLTHVQAITWNQNVRCNSLASCGVRIHNIGTTQPDVTVSYSFPTNMQFVNSTLPPTTQAPGLITWDIADLPSFGFTYIELHLQCPDQSFSGDLFTFTSSVDVTDDITTPLITMNESQNLSCAYDPNDIQEITGHTDQLYVNGMDELDYTIRFQNTGNAEAIDVMVKDQLPTQLDPGSVSYVMSSHADPIITIDENNKLRFVFENINLPDSGTNEPASHGFVRFRIKPMNVLTHGTAIPNTAEIVFDLNEPVITNTVVNHVFDCNTFTPQFVITSEQVCFDQSTTASYSYEWADDVSWTDNFPGSNPIQGDVVTYPAVENQFMLTLHAENELCGAIQQTEIVGLIDLITPQIVAADDVICNGESTTLASNFENGNAWLINGNALSNAQEIEVTQIGNYSLMVTQGECVSDMEDFFLEVNGGPTQPQVISTTTQVSTDYFLGLTYQWYDGGEAIDGATSNVFTPSEAGAYSVVATNEFGCSTSSQVVDFALGLNESVNGVFSVYPNPTTDYLRILFNEEGNKTIEIVAMDGKKTLEKTCSGRSVVLNLHGIASGQYVIRVVGDSMIRTQKLIVE